MPEEIAALAPTLTKFDRRVLATLDQWTEDRSTHEEPLEWRDVWEVARRMRSYDVKAIREILDGLAGFGHVTASGWDHRRAYVATPWRHGAD